MVTNPETQEKEKISVSRESDKLELDLFDEDFNLNFKYRDKFDMIQHKD